MYRCTTLLLLTVLAGLPLASAHALPRPLAQNVIYLSQNSGSPDVVRAVETLLKTSFFDDLVASWKEHKQALSSSFGPSAGGPWRQGLDVVLTHHVDPQELGLSVSVHAVHGPVTVEVNGKPLAGAFVAACSVWNPLSQHESVMFALEIEGKRVAKVHDAFTARGDLPPELTESSDVAWRLRLGKLEAAAAPEARLSIARLIACVPVTARSFADQVVEAYDASLSGGGADPLARLRARLESSVYWYWADKCEPVAEDPETRVFQVLIHGVSSPRTVVVAGQARQAHVADVEIRYDKEYVSRGRKDVRKPFAVFVKNNEIQSVTDEFTAK